MRVQGWEGDNDVRRGHEAHDSNDVMDESEDAGRVDIEQESDTTQSSAQVDLQLDGSSLNGLIKKGKDGTVKMTVFCFKP